MGGNLKDRTGLTAQVPPTGHREGEGRGGREGGPRPFHTPTPHYRYLSLEPRLTPPAYKWAQVHLSGAPLPSRDVRRLESKTGKFVVGLGYRRRTSSRTSVDSDPDQSPIHQFTEESGSQKRSPFTRCQDRGPTDQGVPPESYPNRGHPVTGGEGELHGKR